MPSVSLSGIFSGNSTAQTVASGKVLPVADATGVTVDTTTYADPFEPGEKLTTLIFPAEAGTQAVLAIANAGDGFPRWLLAADGSTGLYFGDGTFDASSGPGFYANSATQGAFNARLIVNPATQANETPQLGQLSAATTITSGALPTHDFTGLSGIGQQILTTRDVDIYVETGTAGSVVAALSPDNTTYTTIYTKTTLATDVCHARVPAGWYLKLTATTAVLGVGTYA